MAELVWVAHGHGFSLAVVVERIGSITLVRRYRRRRRLWRKKAIVGERISPLTPEDHHQPWVREAHDILNAERNKPEQNNRSDE